jgi:hypothetical protein
MMRSAVAALLMVLLAGCAWTSLRSSEGGRINHSRFQSQDSESVQELADKTCARFGKQAILEQSVYWSSDGHYTDFRCVEKEPE